MTVLCDEFYCSALRDAEYQALRVKRLTRAIHAADCSKCKTVDEEYENIINTRQLIL